MRRILLAVLLLALPATAPAQNFAGSYVYQSPNGPIQLLLQQQGAVVTGTMRGTDGSVFELRGEFANGLVTGLLSTGGGTGWFATNFVGAELKMVVAELDQRTGQPDLSSGWELTFTRAAGAQAGAQAGAPQPVPGAAPPAPPVAPVAPGGTPGRAGGVPPQDETTPEIREWLDYFRGKRLTYMESYSSNDARGSGGYSNTWEADLCSDGTFFYRSSSSLSLDTGGATASRHGSGGAPGIWRIVQQGGQIILQYQLEGSAPESALLSYNQNRTYVGNQRVFVTRDNQLCG
jgi:hypothetical protein